MSIFAHPRFVNAPEPNFSGLFRLIDDFDKYSQNGSDSRHSRQIPTFTPKFDLKETEGTFELHGELPGIEKENVHIEFTDPQTIVVRGKVERSYTSDTDEPVVVDHEDSDTASNKSLQPTVEDDVEDGNSTAQPTPATTVAETSKSEAPAQTPKPAVPKAKYWVSERSVGEFTRSFTFPTRVESEAVKASLNNGILTVSVPKAKKHENRRIAIN